jgi:hypothetical protein
MKHRVLIGYPAAGVPWHVASRIKMDGWSWWGEGAGGGEPMRISWGILPPNIEEMGARSGGDITGAKGSQAARARAVGVGQDRTVARARALADYASNRKFKRFTKDQVVQVDKDKLVARAIEIAPMGCDVATITIENWKELSEIESEIKALEADTTHEQLLAAIAADQEIGRKVMILAGGRAFADGAQVSLNGAGMAARAARYLAKRRGVEPSSTSLQDGAASAALAIWREWLAYSAVCDVWNEAAARHLAQVGWRAAYASFRRDASEGRTGRKAGEDKAHGSQSLTIGEALEHLDKQALASWARDRQGRLFVQDGASNELRATRREILNWIASVLNVRASGRTGIAERARFSVIVRLVHGRGIASAARASAFASPRAALESFRAGKVWARLRDSASRYMGAREQALLAMRKRYATEARLAINCQRAAQAGAGKFELVPAIACKPVTVRSGTARAIVQPGRMVIKRAAGMRKLARTGISGRGRVHSQARAWREAVEWRAQAIALARAARKSLRAAQAKRAAEFDLASRGWRAGWLR